MLIYFTSMWIKIIPCETSNKEVFVGFYLAWFKQNIPRRIVLLNLFLEAKIAFHDNIF